MEIARDEFGKRQAEMTARWFENVKAAHGDTDKYLETRRRAYLDRWNEAGRFISDDAHVLDIGGGNLFPELINYFRKRGFRYDYLDVDAGAVAGSRDLAQHHGLTDATFALGFNDKLSFDDEAFDAVFSSHCIEHSIDLAATFRELNRVIRLGGNLLMAVPFGWELNPEHPYFFGPAEWIALVEDAGFTVRVAQIGSEYPEHGEDYFIAARKVGPPSSFQRISPEDFLKESFNFTMLDDATISYDGVFDRRDDCTISADPDATVRIAIPAGASEVLPLFHRHSWSGIARVTMPSHTFDSDLYSWFNYDMPVRVQEITSEDEMVSIFNAGKSSASKFGQYVFKGYMWR